MANIVFVNRFFYPDYSATSQLLTDLVLYLSDRNFEVKVITGRQLYDAPAAHLPPIETWRNIEIYRIRAPRFGRANLLGRLFDYLGFYLGVWLKLLCLLQQGDVVVAKTDPPMLGVAIVSAVALRKARLINWLHDIFPEIAQALGVRFIPGPLAGLLVRLRDRNCRYAAINVVIGEQMRNYLLARDIASSRIRVIPNWAPEGTQPTAHMQNDLRKEWGFSDDQLVIGYSGNLGRAHEFETLLKAAKRLEGDARFRFLFVGSGARLREVGAYRGLGNVVLKPYQARERLSDSLSVPDVHIVSLRPELEGFMVPSKIYSIAAVGRPAIFIGDEEGEVARMLKRDRFGWAVSVGDVSSLVDLLHEMASDPRHLEHAGRNARAAHKRHYATRYAFERWQAVLEGMAKS